MVNKYMCMDGPVGADGYPGTPAAKTGDGLKFLVKFNEVSKNLETPVENALNTAEKIRSRFPGAEIDVEMDVKIL